MAHSGIVIAIILTKEDYSPELKIFFDLLLLIFVNGCRMLFVKIELDDRNTQVLVHIKIRYRYRHPIRLTEQSITLYSHIIIGIIMLMIFISRSRT